MSSATKIKGRQTLIRIIMTALLVLLGCALFYYGKDHDIILDNKSVVIDGVCYEAIPYLTAAIDGNSETELELYPDDRDMAKVSGPRHTIKIAVVNEETEEIVKTVERTLSLGISPSVMLSLPAVVAEASDVMLPLPKTNAPQDDGNSEENAEESM